MRGAAGWVVLVPAGRLALGALALGRACGVRWCRLALARGRLVGRWCRACCLIESIGLVYILAVVCGVW